MRDSELKEHGVWQLLSQASAALDGYPDDEQRTISYLEAKERIEYIRWTLDQSDPSLLTRPELDQVQNALQQIVNHIQQNSGRAQRLAQLDQWFAPIVEKFPYPRVRKIFRSERTEILNEFEQEILRLRGDATDFYKELERRQSGAIERINASEVILSEVTKSIAALDARVNSEFEKWEARGSQQISERLAELSNEFTNDQASRRSEYQQELDLIAARLRDIESQREASQKELQATLSKLKSEAESEKASLLKLGSEFLEKIKKIYQISGQTALAGDFENAAKSESKLGRNFSILSSIFFVVAPLFFAYQWAQISIESSDPLGLVFKLSSALAFLIPAAYFGNTARRHHRVATAMRSLGIKVATFDAYLANFPDEERNRIKEQMAELFFASQISPDLLSRGNPKEVERALGLVDTALTQMQSTLRSFSPGN
jgi:hypothetical protein